MKTAVIGIGSNSVRMLVAQLEGDRGRRLYRDRAGTRLFAGLDAQGRLDRAAMETTVNAVAQMAAMARTDGAEEVLLFATSATRDAANKDELADMLRERAQVELIVCSGEEEAQLSFLGATGGGYCGVIDIGGGSTEVVVGDEDALACSFSTQMGAVRLFREMTIASAADVPTVCARARQLLEEKLADYPELTLPERWYGTGGTFTTLASVTRNMPWTERAGMHGTLLTREAVERVARQLADLSVEERREIPGLQPNRADIIVHGVCILMACMERLGIRELRTSEYGNIDGFMKRHYGLTGGLD